MRSGVAREALQQLITQAALNQELQRLHIVTPDQAVRQTVFAMPAFRGPNGQFDRQTFETLLRNNGLTERALPRHDARRPGAAAVARCRQRRRGNAGRAAAPAVSRASSRSARPTWWNSRSPPRPNRPHRPRPSCSAGTTTIPDQYSAPEYRRIKAVVLSPQTLAKDIPITDADLQAAYRAAQGAVREAGASARPK